MQVTAFLPATPLGARHRQPKVSSSRNFPKASYELPAVPVKEAAQKALNLMRAKRKNSPSYRRLQERHRIGPEEFRKRQKDLLRNEYTRPAKGVARGPRRSMLRDGIALSNLVVGCKLRGVVQNMMKYGVYVDVGAITDGFVHVRDMSVEFLHDPRDMVRSGDQVDVWVKYVDTVKNVLGLSMLKPKMGFGGRVPVAEIKKGDRFRGVIERLTNFGAYVDVGAERLAFMHVSAIWGLKPRETLESLKLGEPVWVEVLDVEEFRRFIRLTARGAEGKKLDEFMRIGELAEMDVKGTVVRSGKMATARPWEELEDDEEDEQGSEDEDEDEEEEKVERDEEFEALFQEMEEQDDRDYAAVRGELEQASLSKEDMKNMEEIENMIDDDTEFLDDYYQGGL